MIQYSTVVNLLPLEVVSSHFQPAIMTSAMSAKNDEDDMCSRLKRHSKCIANSLQCERVRLSIHLQIGFSAHYSLKRP